MNNKKPNIETYLKNFKEEFLNKSEPLRKEIEHNIRNLVKSHSDEQIIELIKQCKLDEAKKVKLINDFKSNTLIFLDWIILAKLTQADKYNQNPPSTTDILKSVGVGDVAQMLGELAEEYVKDFSLKAYKLLLPPDYKFNTIVVDGREAVDPTKGPFSKYFNLLSDFKSKMSEYTTRTFDDFLMDKFLGTDIAKEERISILQSFSMNPKYLTEPRSKLAEALLKMSQNGFKENPNFPGFESVFHDYQAEYYKGQGKAKKKKQTTNTFALHRPYNDPKEPDFRDLTEYTDVDFNKSLLNQSSNIILSREDMEVYNGIETCIHYYLSQFPDKRFRDECKIPLTFNDIAIGMGYSRLTDKLKTQIGRSLAKFDNLRCTNFWKDELKARGLLDSIDELIDMYGDVVSVEPVAPKLLNIDYVWITKNKSPKTSPIKNKNDQSVKFDGKPGIIIKQFPPLTAYNLITDQIIYIPTEWVNIPRTGTSQEMKRIKRYLCRRIQTLIYFQDKEDTKGKYDKRNFNPNQGNYNKIILDDLLVNIGGYDMKIKTEFPYQDLDGNILIGSSGKPLMREATPEEIRKQKKSLLTQRRRHINNILNYLEKLKEIIPKIKKITVETENGKDHSLRIIIG